jgi:hypothetical protein
MSPRVILIEFNELCPPLLQRWMADGSLPNFRRFFESSQVFVTDTDEHEPLKLEPWIQWYSLHTGLPFDRHGVFNLTDGPRQTHDDIWHMLARAGKRVGSMSSMNVRRIDAPSSFYVPDPWADHGVAEPASAVPYVEFIARQVQEHTAREGFGLGNALGFAKFMLGNGRRAATILHAVKQVLSEKSSGNDTRWRRASLLDHFQLDLFLDLYRKYQPDFCTFFSNSTAHYQHAYWRHMEPECFSIKPTAKDLERYGDAIAYGYRHMDSLLGDFFELERRQGATLIFATALSQQPYLDAEQRGGQLYYRPVDFAAFLESQSITYERLEPIMTAQYILRGATAGATRAAADALLGFRVDGTQIFEVQEQEPTKLCVANWIHGVVPKDALVTHVDGRAPLRYFDVFYKLDVMKSGRHHPDGALWIKTGQHRAHEQKVSILSVVPTILDLMEVEYDRATFSPSLLPSSAKQPAARPLVARKQAATKVA